MDALIKKQACPLVEIAAWRPPLPVFMCPRERFITITSWEDSSNTSLSNAVVLCARFLSFLLPERLPCVPSSRSWKIPSFPSSLKEPRRTAWEVINNYSISHSVQWKQQQFIRRRGPEQMDHEIWSFSVSGSSFQSIYLPLVLFTVFNIQKYTQNGWWVVSSKKQGYI